MIDYKFFLEDGDLLEQVELYEMLNQDIITEMKLAGVKITKEKLQDEEFVKELTNKIRNNRHIIRDGISMIMELIGFISMISVVGAPIGLLLLAISNMIKSGYDINQQDLKKLDKCFDKTISKLKSKLSKTKNEDEKDELKDIIKKLEENKKSISDNSSKIEKIIDMSNYDDEDNLKIGNTSLYTNVSFLLTMSDWAIPKQLDKIKNDLKPRSNIKIFNDIEDLAINGITTEKELLKFVDNETSKTNFDNQLKDYGPSVTKSLKGKNFYVLIDTPHDTEILYCYDDNCCYIWVYDADDIIHKVSNSEVLKKSKIAYDDIIKIIKEYEK